MPAITQRELPAYVRRNRDVQAKRNEHDRGRFEQAAEAHIAGHRQALDFVASRHQWIADSTDLDLVGNTRPAAVWQLAGRGIGVARLMLDALSLGYTAEVLHLARALHELDRMIMIFGEEEGTPLVRQWLEDEDWVRPRQTLEAEEAYEERLAAAMREQGLPEIPRTKDLTRRLYGGQSEAAHHRRKWTQDAVAPQLRTMISGPTEVWERRAATVAAMVGVVEECVTTVGGALALFYGPGWFERRIKPWRESFEALRATAPLT